METENRGPGRPRDEGLAQRRQGEILAEASRLFAEFGYRTADVQVLADRLGVGKGTVYRYFPTKEALFFAAVDMGIRGLVDHIDAATEGVTDPIVHMQRAVRAYLGYFDQHPFLVELLIIERAEFRDREKATYFLYKERQHTHRRTFVESAIAQGVIRPIDPERVMRIFSDTLYGIIFTNHFARRKMPYEEHAADIIDIVFHGILTDAARAQLAQNESR